MRSNQIRRYRRALQEMTVAEDCPLSGTVVVPADVRPRDAARMAIAALRPVVIAKIAKLRDQSREA